MADMGTAAGAGAAGLAAGGPIGGLAGLAAGAVAQNLFARKGKRARRKARKAQRQYEAAVAKSNRFAMQRRLADTEHNSYLNERQLEEQLASRGLMGSPSRAVDIGDELRKRAEASYGIPGQDVGANYGAEADYLRNEELRRRFGLEPDTVSNPFPSNPAPSAAPAQEDLAAPVQTAVGRLPRGFSTQSMPEIQGMQQELEEYVRQHPNYRSQISTASKFAEMQAAMNQRIADIMAQQPTTNTATPRIDPNRLSLLGESTPSISPRDGLAGIGGVTDVPRFAGSSSADEALGELRRSRSRAEEEATANVQAQGTDADFSERLRQLQRNVEPSFWGGVLQNFGTAAASRAGDYGAQALGDWAFPSAAQRSLGEIQGQQGLGGLASPSRGGGIFDEMDGGYYDILGNRRKRAPSVGALK